MNIYPKEGDMVVWYNKPKNLPIHYKYGIVISRNGEYVICNMGVENELHLCEIEVVE